PSSETGQKQIRQIETDLSKEKEQFLKLGLKEKDLLGQLAEIERKIGEQRQFLKKIKEKLRLNRKALERQQDKLRHLERSSKEVRQRLSKRLTAFYKYGKRGYVHLLTTSQDVEQLRRRMKYLRVIMEGDQKLLQQLADVEQEISQEIKLIEERVAIIDGMKRAESDRLLSIREEQDRKVFLLMKVHSEKEFYETLVKELQHASQNLKVTLMDLDRKQKKKRALPSDFANYKGKLPLPFSGKIIRSHDQWGVDIVKMHKGIFIQGPLGSEVRAVFAGRVDFSGRLKGYGQTIVINHGSRFFTVSAHLSDRFREEGDMVEKGTVIGLLGHTGPFEKPRLYFEIRRAGTPLNPLTWVKVN
ncbi:MAG: peptidoglycan DD-metalloendopeptidase family protein, partial [Desulfobacteraceae bacterium]